MSLRNELQARMYACTNGIDGIAGLSDYEDACNLARADECIRQMEWAKKEAHAESHRLITQRRNPASIFINIEDVLHFHDDLWTCPLTLAPEDWNV